ncbi:Kre1p [Kluyveromyces lactis]|uniref:KLLA0E21055p n=1 Tax=Kluyveromyces lactis (strain ATCC 8585 / CBS 2359 / DSM 70799 / NBRC 1267 / NRRL Y-1140 / WM37) TaxID=284590 RepID=Q6CMD7_KLULA|nr:uncharacterized protein KLLA0_E21055g [Kluyveromyces lactis]CAG99989.1 KLLA0E21055p [Kluyveromyces lactis]|eukprot:XP_454902.1 uncharacterized protein KLLA0_E21055g [Kluyveromyces lactis]
MRYTFTGLLLLLVASFGVEAQLITSTLTSINVAGATVTLVTVIDSATIAAAAAATAVTTTTPTTAALAAGATTASTSTTGSTTTTTPVAAAAAATDTDTTSVATTTAAVVANAADTASSTTASTTSAATAAAATGTRPDPSTSMTPLPSGVGTPIDSYVTLTFGTTSTTTSKRQPTSIWVTKTISGVTTAFETPFYQKFSSQYTAVSSASSGSVGLGTLSGTVGVVKSKIVTTISGNHAVYFAQSSATMTSMILTVLMMFI